MLPRTKNAIRFASISEYTGWCRAARGRHAPLVDGRTFVPVPGAAIPGYHVPPELAEEWRRMSLREASYWLLFARGYDPKEIHHFIDA